MGQCLVQLPPDDLVNGPAEGEDLGCCAFTSWPRRARGRPRLPQDPRANRGIGHRHGRPRAHPRPGRIPCSRHLERQCGRLTGPRSPPCLRAQLRPPRPQVASSVHRYADPRNRSTTTTMRTRHVHRETPRSPATPIRQTGTHRLASSPPIASLTATGRNRRDARPSVTVPKWPAAPNDPPIRGIHPPPRPTRAPDVHRETPVPRHADPTDRYPPARILAPHRLPHRPLSWTGGGRHVTGGVRWRGGRRTATPGGRYRRADHARRPGWRPVDAPTSRASSWGLAWAQRSGRFARRARRTAGSVSPRGPIR